MSEPQMADVVYQSKRGSVRFVVTDPTTGTKWVLQFDSIPELVGHVESLFAQARFAWPDKKFVTGCGSGDPFPLPPLNPAAKA